MPTYKLKEEQALQIKKAQEAYNVAVDQAVKTVSEEIVRETGTEKAVEGFEIKKIMDEYLCGVFSEIQVRWQFISEIHCTFTMGEDKTFERYDYVIERYLINI